MLDQADGLKFTTPGDRCRYLGKASWEKPQWLKDNPDKWRRIEDVQREAASLAAPVKSEVNVVAASSGADSQISSHDVRKCGNEKSDTTFVNTPADNSSAPYQPTSLSTLMNEDVPSGSTQTQLPPTAGETPPAPVAATGTNKTTNPALQPTAEAAMIDAERPKSAATPVGAKGRKQARYRGRRRNKQKAPVKVTNGSGKFSPERARVVLDSLSERPIQSYAAEKAGIHRKTLENWIKRSKAGEDGYDIEHEDVTMRFHVHCEWSKDAAYDKILEQAYLIAMGKAYVTDENGNVTLETVRPPNLKMMRFLLEWVRPEVYGNKPPKPDVPQRSGVILVGAPEKPKRTCAEASIKARSWKALSRKFRQTKD